MSKIVIPNVTLNNGIEMPQLGLGVYKSEDGEQVINAVKWAVEAGYRSIDTASLYHNETGVGQAVRECGVPREQLFITTKVWNTEQGYEKALGSFEESRRKLGLEYVDLFLIHWPGKTLFKETWRALEKLYREGLVRAIGVSNFNIHHLEELAQGSDIVPTVNQVELHPLLTQKDLIAYCSEKGIKVEAWSPIMKGNLNHPVLLRLAEKYGKSPAQIVLRWDIQIGIITIPKSVHADRIRSNADVFDFELTADEIASIDVMNQNSRFGPDPDEFF